MVGVQPVNTNINPALGHNTVFTHYTQPAAGNPQLGLAYPAPATPQSICPVSQTILTPLTPIFNMGDYYQNATPFNPGLNFQPQVPDTSNGPMVHVYQPRIDPPGVVYVQSGPPVSQPQYYYCLQPVATPARLVWKSPVCLAHIHHASLTVSSSPSHLWSSADALGSDRVQ